MALSLEQLSSQLIEAGLLSAPDLDVARDEFKPLDAEQFLKQLVKQKLLTTWQAQQVYAGKAKTLVLGNYVLLDKLGQGGMGVVLKAQHRRMKRLVALKVLSPAVAKSAESLARFHREVEAAAKLTHPNIVAAFDADESNGTSFLVMEFVDGKDLASVVKAQGPLSIAQATKCILQAARGLEYAHQLRIIHRDIKPANLLIDHHGNVKILDMGLARVEAEAGKNELTSTGAVMGTVDYMAPEQALSSKHADARSDIYSLGISLWYLLTAKSAYDGDSMMARLLGHRDAPIPSLAAALAQRTSGKPIPPQHAAAIDAIFHKMVAKKPDERYQSMREVIEALEGIHSGETSSAPLTATASGAINSPSSTTALAGATRVDPEAATALSPPDDDHLVPGSPFAATLASKSEDTDAGPTRRLTKKKAATPKSESAIKTLRKPHSKSSSRNWTVGGSVTAVVLLGVVILSFTGKKGSTDAEGLATSNASITGSSSAPAVSTPDPPNVQPGVAASDTSIPPLPPVARLSGITFDEPPSLDEWLKGRSVLQVSKDGRGQFQTIQAALAVLKPGQAIEVLDRGPYQEAIKLTRPPADTGIFSRVQTTLEIPGWEKYTGKGDQAEYLHGYQLFFAKGFRLSGLEITGKVETVELQHVALYCEGSGGVIVEDCQVRLQDLAPEEPNYPAAIKLNGFGTDAAQSNVVRNCAVNGQIGVVAWPGVVAAPVAVIHNYVRPMADAGISFSGPFRRVFLRENVVRTDSHRAAFVLNIRSPGSELIEICRNTVVGSEVNRFQGGIPSGEVVIQDNVGPVFKLAKGAENHRSETENWHVSGNWYSIRPESMPNPENLVFRRLSDPLAEVKFLSEDPANPNFARLKPVAGGAIAGALPPGPVGAGDWFTTLQQRWSLFGTTASGAPARNQAPAVASQAATYNLIPMLNLAADRISLANLTGKNEWTAKDETLTYTSDGKSGKVMFPILMNDVRAFTIEADVRRTSGSGVFSLAIPVSDSLMTSLDLTPGGNIQLGVAGGRRQTIGQWPQTTGDSAHLKVDVDERPDGSGTIAVTVGIREVARWGGSIRTIGKSLEFHPEYPGQRLLGLFCFKDSFEFKNLKLSVRDGAARPLR